MELHASIRSNSNRKRVLSLGSLRGADDCAEGDRVLDTTGEPDTASNKDTYTLSGTSTTHGSMYYATVSICNKTGVTRP